MNLRDRVVDPFDPTSLAGKARAKRLRLLISRFPDLSEMRVLDLGGAPQFWVTVPVRPLHVTLVNLQAHPVDHPQMTMHIADACALPRGLSSGYDLVVSNSLLEHVGGHHRRERFADVVQEAAPHHWVQTPYRYFPIEPHFVFPAHQFLPLGVRAAVGRRWRWSHVRSTTHAASIADALEIELVGIRELRHYFPESEILHERFLGLVKSLIAVK